MPRALRLPLALSTLLAAVALPAWAEQRPAVDLEAIDDARPARAEHRPAIDPEAIDEAIHPAAEPAYSSHNAYKHYLRARIAEANGDNAAALEELRQALAFDPESAELRLAVGWIHARDGDLEAAAAEAERALRREPGRWDAHLLLGKVRVAQKRRKEAKASLTRAVALAAKEPDGRMRLERFLARDPDPRLREAVEERMHAARAATAVGR